MKTKLRRLLVQTKLKTDPATLNDVLLGQFLGKLYILNRLPHFLFICIFKVHTPHQVVRRDWLLNVQNLYGTKFVLVCVLSWLPLFANRLLLVFYTFLSKRFYFNFGWKGLQLIEFSFSSLMQNVWE